jgi:hypothetical protein
MCNDCGGTCERGIAVRVGTRNAVLPGYTDRDTGQNTEGFPRKQLSREEVGMYFDAMQARYMRMMANAVYDQSHPVEDFAPVGMLTSGSPAPGSTMTLNIPTDYDMPVRYEAVSVVIPAAALTMQLQLGNRVIGIRSVQTPITGTVDFGQLEPALFVFPFTGMILNSDDARVLTVTYANVVASATQQGNSTPTEPFVSLTGFALTRGQYS